MNARRSICRRPSLRLVVDNGSRPRPRRRRRLDEARHILRGLWAGMAWKG